MLTIYIAVFQRLIRNLVRQRIVPRPHRTLRNFW